MRTATMNSATDGTFFATMSHPIKSDASEGQDLNKLFLQRCICYLVVSLAACVSLFIA